jgi:hypothetical protein
VTGRLAQPGATLIGHHSDARHRGKASMKYFVVQPYGRDKGRDSTIVYEAQSLADAFAEIDRLAARMRRTGARPETVELLVVDEQRRVIRRPAQ